MAKILFVLSSEEAKMVVADTIEEHRQYFSSFFQEYESFEVEMMVGQVGEKLNINTSDTDIIVSRGFTATGLKKLYQNIPIVEIPITATDVIISARMLQQQNINSEPIALIGFGDINYQASVASNFCSLNITPFYYFIKNMDDKDIIKLVDDVSRQGFKNIIGGVRTVEAARKQGINAVFIQFGRESIWLAITEAQHIARIRRMERERAAHFETILNYSREGIISTDKHNKVIHINSSAGKILNINTESSIGSPLESIIPDPQFMKMMRNKQEYTDEIYKIKKSEVVLNKVGIPLGNEMIGNVVTFQNISNVQKTEIKIRSKLYSRGLTAKYSFSDIIGESEILKETINKAKTFAKVPSNILIIGKTGTGKELFSQSIHNFSNRVNGPFVAVNCAAIPDNLMESEFFGYVGGAFTGASKEGKPGYFELAHEGTIFLDEISEIPLNLQGKLLRVIQESEVMRIGHDKIIPVNIRIICATNKDLESLVAQEKFREDLYYRLSILQLRLPSLCERGQDILLLAKSFIKQYINDFLKKDLVLSPEAEKLFLKYSWNGNIRELRNICEQLVVLNTTGIITENEVFAVLPVLKSKAEKDTSAAAVPDASDFSYERSKFEKDLIIKALRECNFNKTKAALLLNMNRTTLWKKLKEYDIECKISL